jgi:hypothetical protein
MRVVELRDVTSLCLCCEFCSDGAVRSRFRHKSSSSKKSGPSSIPQVAEAPSVSLQRSSLPRSGDYARERLYHHAVTIPDVVPILLRSLRGGLQLR